MISGIILIYNLKIQNMQIMEIYYIFGQQILVRNYGKKKKVIYHYHIWKISGYSNILDKYYFYTFLEKDKDRIKQNTNGSTMVHITKGMMEERVLTFPSLPEQTAIGSFFQDIDQLISLQQRKLEVLKEQKKTYLKLLFPAKGQIKPALRFAGFEDDWKEVKLGEVTNRYDNLRVPVSANERISGDTPYYGANGIQDYVDGLYT